MNDKDSASAQHERIWQVVHAIPAGKVATYGQVASLADLPRHARLVGRVMSQLPRGSRLPWHRVINAQGRLSTHSTSRQRELLQAEGVVFLNGRINLSRYQWQP
jgi:methylated-DNA-protein-cysteine methyltransferase-like protein|tara:strand:- start:853 stop:1164 length:312 start_codon:yes stop_codon:yes gene_type:complete